MNIETKFDMHEDVFFLKAKSKVGDFEVIQANVQEINITIDEEVGRSVKITYRVVDVEEASFYDRKEDMYEIEEENLFSNEQDIIKLFRENIRAILRRKKEREEVDDLPF